MSSHKDKTIFQKIDAAVLLAVEDCAKNEAMTTHTLAFDKPTSPEDALLSVIHMLPHIRRPLIGSMILGFKEDAKLLLIKDSIKRLVRQKKIVGYTLLVPTLLLRPKIPGNVEFVTPKHVMRKTRRYRPINALEAMARV